MFRYLIWLEIWSDWSLDYWKKAIKLTINVFNGLFVIDELQVSDYFGGGGAFMQYFASYLLVDLVSFLR